MAITRVAQESRDGNFLDGQAQSILGPQPDSVVVAADIARADRALQPAHALLIAAGHERGPRGRALGAVGIALGESHAFGGEPVEGRRFHVAAAVAAEVAIAQVVGEDQDDVGPTRQCGGAILSLSGQRRSLGQEGHAKCRQKTQ